jgi:Family of unknown function (DUF6445)
VFNPQPRIERVPIAGDGQGQEAAWVIDDVLLEPERLRQHAIDEQQRFVAAPHNAYPGLEWQMDADVSKPLSDFFMLHVRGLLRARRTLSMYSRLSLATLQAAQLRPLQRLCHRDRFGTTVGQGVAACVIYLFDAPERGGTSFYRPRRSIAEIDANIRRWNSLSDEAFTQEIGAPPAYLTASNAHFELRCTVPAAWNRAVFYDGGQFHSSHIIHPELLSADPAAGRLTLNGFFITRQMAS